MKVPDVAVLSDPKSKTITAAFVFVVAVVFALYTKAPETLIYGTLAETFSFLKTPQDVQLYEQKYAQAVQNLAQTQMGRKRRDEYADGVLRIPLKSVGPGGR